MIELNVTQGSPEWLAARAKCFNASEAPAMMGVSPYKTRSALLSEKATGIVPEVDAATQARFDMGHEVEALARPLVEEIIGEELYPIVATDDTGRFLASSDGATMLCDIGFEHKAFNKDIAFQVDNGIVPESHRAQLDHQFMVFGFEKIIFVCSDGTRENLHYCWYYPQPERIAALRAGWEQFEKDLANYKPEPETVKPVGEKIEGLPALIVQVEGRVVATNMDAFKAAADSFLARLPSASDLKTDQDFADADQAAKDCKDAEEKLQIVKAQAQSQAVSIDEAFRAIDHISEKIRAARLSLEKVVKAEKENRKAEVVSTTQAEYEAYCFSVASRVGIPAGVFPRITFGETVKGLKTIASMKDKLSVALANAKVETNAIADRIENNRKLLGIHGHLFPDFDRVCTKLEEDFSSLVSARVAQDEQRKQQEEATKAAAQAKPEPVAAPIPEVRQVSNVIAEPANDNGQTIKLGEICSRLGFTVTADFLSSLGVNPSGTERAAKLYPASKFPTICRLISDHVLALAFKKAA